MSFRFSRVIVFSICLISSVVASGLASPVLRDSIGIEKLGNKTFIVHKVDPKETLFSLAKKYKVKVELIEIENPELREGMKVGQLLRIPYQTVMPTAQAPAQQTPKGKKHVVEQGQTLYSISRIYNVNVNDIKKWNNLESNELNVGQEIIVGGDSPETDKTKPTPESPSVGESEGARPKADSNSKTHIAEAGQTLYSISRIYNVSVDDLKKWNGLVTNDIATGQELIIAISKEKASPKSEVVNTQKPVAEKAVIKEDSQQMKKTAVEPVGSNSESKAEAPKPKPAPVESPTTTSKSTSFEKVIERGLAEAIDETGDNPKFLALHKSAAPGTIIQVKNELNNLYIFARVIGKLPATGGNEKLVVKLSKKAYDKLGAVDRRFPVEVSYVP